MVAEIALALALLTGAGLMAKSYRQLSQLDPGYRQRGVLAAYLELPASRYQDIPQAQAFVVRLLEKLRALPGVQHVALATDSPLDGNDSASNWFSDSPAADPKGNEFRGYLHAVTPEFFATEGIAFVAGGTFDSNLTATSEPVAIVSESFAKRYWPNASAVGHRFKRGNATGNHPWLRIVGVVRETKYRGLPDNPTNDPDLYFPIVQMGRRSFSFLVHTENSAAALLPEARRVVSELDRELPLFNTGTIEHRIARRTAGPRFTAQLIGLFSGVALVLACLGIYGVVSFNVGLRTQELGVRQALGASRADIFRLVLFGTSRLTAVGLGAGLLLSFLLSLTLRSQLYHVAASDPSIYAAGAVLLALVALLAAWLPARRAAGVDPMAALRNE
jgi:putative ABC transport system permease protein